MPKRKEGPRPLKPYQRVLLQAMGSRRWNVQALVEDIVAQSTMITNPARKSRFVAAIATLQARGYVAATGENEIRITDTGAAAIKDQPKKARPRKPRA